VIAGINREKRGVLEEDEVLRLEDLMALVVHKGVPYLALKIPYTEDIVLSQRAAMPAPAVSDSLFKRSSTWGATGTTGGMVWNLTP
jgi:type IV secretory pathway TraG/TraD family ATPase VirD4